MTINKKVASLFCGLGVVASLGLAKVVKAESNNLKDYDVPSVEGLTPYKTKWLDKTDKIDGKETKLEYYKVNGDLIAIYSIDGKQYSVGLDHDWKRPIDVSLIDHEGNGQYEPFAEGKPFYAPDWVVKQ